MQKKKSDNPDNPDKLQNGCRRMKILLTLHFNK